MEDMEARVWQRVLGQQESPAEDLKPLILAAQEAAAVYEGLGLRQLLEEAQRILACLRGISALQGRRMVLKPMQVPKEPKQKALEKCYYRSRKAMLEYTARSAGPEFGEVFRALAEREKEQCLRIVQLLGSMR